MSCQNSIDQIYQKILTTENSGEIATYIPALANADTSKFGVCLSSVSNNQYQAGDFQETFSIQSIAKVFALSLAYEQIGDSIWQRVDVEPSGAAFNSLIQLELEDGIPRNPLINAGAIVICDLLCEHFENPKQEILRFIRAATDNEQINFDTEIANSEQETGFRNYAMANLMKSFGNIHHPIEEVLDVYFHLCSIKMDCQTLSRSFLFLANEGKLINSDTQLVNSKKVKRINAIMQTCGFYDEAGEFSFRVGLPGKSGVGGGIAAVLPGKYAIAVWSPKLNKKGNSHRGFLFLEQFTSETTRNNFLELMENKEHYRKLERMYLNANFNKELYETTKLYIRARNC